MLVWGAGFSGLCGVSGGGLGAEGAWVLRFLRLARRALASRSGGVLTMGDLGRGGAFLRRFLKL